MDVKGRKVSLPMKTFLLFLFGLFISVGGASIVNSNSPAREEEGIEAFLEERGSEIKVPSEGKIKLISATNLYGTNHNPKDFIGGKSFRVKTKHKPLYKATAHTSTITAYAEEKVSGIKGVALTITVGQMTDCTEWNRPPSMVPCRKNASTFQHICTYPDTPKQTVCEYSAKFGNETLVSYQAVVTSGKGRTAESEEITYAVGDPPLGVARPIWWHRPNPMQSNPWDSKIDLGFFPHDDYRGSSPAKDQMPFYTAFTVDLEKVISGAFFNINQPFANVYTVNINCFNLWTAPFGPAPQGTYIGSNYIPYYNGLEDIWGAMDGRVIVHKNEFSDYGQISLGGWGSVWGGAKDPSWILIHESGHFLHGLGDEYCCCGGNQPGCCGGYAAPYRCKNNFVGENECRQYATQNGFDPDRCVRIKCETADGVTIASSDIWWRFDGDLDIMKDRKADSDWKDGCRKCVLDRFGRCRQGNCYPGGE